MLIDTKENGLELLNIIIKASHIRSRYKHLYGKPHHPYLPSVYIELIAGQTGFTITRETLSWGSYIIRGGLLRFSSFEAKIGVAKTIEQDALNGITECDQRYIAVKEASHLVIDDHDSYIDVYSDFIDDFLFRSSIADFGKNSISDMFLSRIFAMELLLPWEERDSEIEAIANKEKTTLDVARKYKIPEREVIEFFHPTTHNTLKKAHDLQSTLDGKYDPS